MAPKQPRKIKDLHKEIMKHKDYKRIPATTRWCFETGCVNGHSWCDKENNKWSREIWKMLFLGEDFDGKKAEEYLLTQAEPDTGTIIQVAQTEKK
jgi:hypothetical protein